MNKSFTTTSFPQKIENVAMRFFRKKQTHVLEKNISQSLLRHIYVSKKSISYIIDFDNPCLFKIDEIHSIYDMYKIVFAHAYLSQMSFLLSKG